MASFGSRLKELRTEKGLNQQELAEAIGTTGGTVSKWERDVRKPEFETLKALCEYFQVSLGYLLGEDVDRALVPPSDETLAQFADEEDEEELIHLTRILMRLSYPTLNIVKATISAAYKMDRKQGTLRQDFLDRKNEELARLIVEEANRQNEAEDDHSNAARS